MAKVKQAHKSRTSTTNTILNDKSNMEELWKATEGFKGCQPSSTPSSIVMNESVQVSVKGGTRND